MKTPEKQTVIKKDLSAFRNLRNGSRIGNGCVARGITRKNCSCCVYYAAGPENNNVATVFCHSTQEVIKDDIKEDLRQRDPAVLERQRREREQHQREEERQKWGRWSALERAWAASEEISPASPARAYFENRGLLRGKAEPLPECIRFVPWSFALKLYCSGQASPGAVVHLSLDGEPCATVRADAGGEFRANLRPLEETLGRGRWEVTAIAADCRPLEVEVKSYLCTLQGEDDKRCGMLLTRSGDCIQVTPMTREFRNIKDLEGRSLRRSFKSPDELYFKIDVQVVPGAPIVMAEGLEKLIALRSMLGPRYTYVCAAGGCKYEALIETMKRDEVKVYLLFADNDQPDSKGVRAGHRSIKMVMDRYKNEDISVLAFIPPKVKDWDDALKGRFIFLSGVPVRDLPGRLEEQFPGMEIEVQNVPGARYKQAEEAQLKPEPVLILNNTEVPLDPARTTEEAVLEGVSSSL